MAQTTKEVFFPMAIETAVVAMPFFYSSCEEIRKRDRVLLHGEPGEIELVADPAESPDDWLVVSAGAKIPH
jgi:hypothetical protein